MEGGVLVHKVEAEGNLLIQYKGRAYVGEAVEYDFVSQTGVIEKGRTSTALWYIGGEKIDLRADGSYKVHGAFVTTCENKDSSWDLHAGKVSIKKQDLFKAKKIRFRLFKVPLLWLPSLKLNLARFKEPFFRYKFDWDKGPLMGVRYQFFSWKDWALYGRLEYRWAVGWGGAFETEYKPEDHPKTTFITRSYAGTNRLQNAPDAAFRYRLQGDLRSETEDEKTSLVLTWDKYSDVRMPADFKTLDFEVNTAKKTRLYIHHTDPSFLTFFKARPRVNPFESIQQELPTLYFSAAAQEWKKTGILSFFETKISYLDFAYSDQLVTDLRDFHAGRLEIKERLFRPFRWGGVTFTPHAGGVAILYSDSPSRSAKGLGAIEYGAKVMARGKREFSRYTHIVEPYLSFYSLTHPTVSPDSHYIFSMDDGYAHINQWQGGIRTLLYSKKRPKEEATLTTDLYADGFMSDPTIPQFIPRLFLKVEWRLPSLTLLAHTAWSFWHQEIFFTNAQLLWTISENIAFSLEGRYRSRYAWRKANHENFILDVTRSEEELLLSPLSDRRVTLLTHLFIRLTPFWELHFRSHHGFYRVDQDPYNEFKLDLYTWISAACKIRLGLTRVAKYDKIRPSVGISLQK